MPQDGDDELEKANLLDESTSTRRNPLSSYLGQAARWLIHTLTPSIFTKPPTRSGKLRRTAYLDGIRGFAAFLVYWHHHELWAHESLFAEQLFQNSFGYKKQYYLATFHGIRTFFDGGHFSVACFFVLSGYVLSTKPLSLLYAGEFVHFGDNIASALFRRWFRLYLPIAAVGFCSVLLWHIFGIYTNFVPEPTFRAEMWRFYCELKNFSFIWGSSDSMWFFYHKIHTWTIRIEMKGSLVIYTTLLALSRCTRKARLWCEVALVVYFMYIADGAYYAMFTAGILICDLDMLAARDELPSWMYRLSSYKQPIFHGLFALGIYLGGVPSSTNDASVLKESPGWYLLSFLKPQAVYDFKWFYLFWAAIFLVVSVSHIGWLKRFFETSFCQYLGRISFMLYLVHGPVLWTLGDRLYAATGWPRESHALNLPHWSNIFPLSKFGPLGLEFGFLVPHIIILPATLWLAELGTTLVDGPSVKFAQWLYRKTLETPTANGQIRPS